MLSKTFGPLNTNKQHTNLARMQCCFARKYMLIWNTLRLWLFGKLKQNIESWLNSFWEYRSSKIIWGQIQALLENLNPNHTKYFFLICHDTPVATYKLKLYLKAWYPIWSSCGSAYSKCTPFGANIEVCRKKLAEINDSPSRESIHVKINKAFVRTQKLQQLKILW